MRLPFNGNHPVTLKFGVAHPVTGTHQGTDYGCPEGTPLLACADATVSFINRSDGNLGNAVELDLHNGYFLRYAHLSVIETSVGSEFAKGQQLGLSGHTGYALGSHLHIEIYRKRNGQPFYFEDIEPHFKRGETMPSQMKPDETLVRLSFQNSFFVDPNDNDVKFGMNFATVEEYLRFIAHSASNDNLTSIINVKYPALQAENEALKQRIAQLESGGEFIKITDLYIKKEK